MKGKGGKGGRKVGGEGRGDREGENGRGKKEGWTLPSLKTN